MKITNEKIKKLIDILIFYGGGKNFKWEGCHCHGHYERCENGDKAYEAIGILQEINSCPKCFSSLNDDDSCTNIQCENYNWDNHEKNQNI